MKTITKYDLSIVDSQTLQLPQFANILSAKLDPSGQLSMWAMVDTTNPLVDCTIRIFGSDVELPDTSTDARFINSVVDGANMWHVFVEL